MSGGIAVRARPAACPAARRPAQRLWWYGDGHGPCQ